MKFRRRRKNNIVMNGDFNFTQFFIYLCIIPSQKIFMKKKIIEIKRIVQTLKFI